MIAGDAHYHEPDRMRIPFLTLALIPAFSVSGAPVDFEAEILPFIEKKCVECHKAPVEENGKTVKPKAGLRLDAAWAFEVGSENGAVFTAGDAEGSPIFERVSLPEDDDDFMPPVGKADPLTDEEKDLLKRWLDEGADFGEWRGNLEGKPESISNTGTSIPVSEIQQLYTRLGEGVTHPDEKVLESVTASGGRVQRLSSTNPLLAVDFRLASTDADDTDILSAQVVASHIAHLDLSKSSATDAAMSLVSETPNLVRLDISNTSIGDEGLKHLKELKELRYLNLHGTAVTDSGLTVLHNLKSLEAVYLWQSKVTEQGAKALRGALPNARINTK